MRKPRGADVGLALPPVLAVVLVLAAIALQLAYLDRLALRVGSDDAGRGEWPRDETAGP